MIRTGTYGEFGDQMIGDIETGERLHGGSFANILFYSPHDAARVYKLAEQYFGPFATAAEFVAQCDWNNVNDARKFVEENPEWPPRSVVEEARYL